MEDKENQCRGKAPAALRAESNRGRRLWPRSFVISGSIYKNVAD